MTTTSNDPTVTGTEWRAALEHAASCPTCRTPGAVCPEGEQLLRTHEEAARQARAGEDA
ncbi:hypothetical protein [Streptomyces antioxidans]|uniref:hypothetical protein n=1 Tax=Streptomyces antioxidans TaxID=1507734 RepID=UPI00142E5F89|nr:hypothetical protein [Streptomyces antioxidans]